MGSLICLRLKPKARLHTIFWWRLLGLLLEGEVGAFHRHVSGGVWLIK